MAKKKFYAVAAGRSCGVFTDWATTEKQVKGFGGAKYKSFGTREEAESWVTNPVYIKKTPNPKAKSYSVVQPHKPGTVVVYTDGGSINNPGPGGYGAVIEDDGKRRELSGGFRLTTNNRMEMMAALVALQDLKDCTSPISLYSDSSYLVNGITKRWVYKWQKNGWLKSDRQPVINRDLWEKLVELLAGLDVQFNWVKGHAGIELNERCDKLAVAAARQTDMPVDYGYEKSL